VMGIVDAVSSLGVADFSIDDYPGVVAWASCPQKGVLSLPLTYAPVSFTDKAIEMVKKRGCRTYVHHPILDARHWGIVDGKDVPNAVYHQTHSCYAVAAFHEALRIILGPIVHGLRALGDRVTPGGVRGASFANEEQLLSMVDEAASQDLIEEDDRDLIHSVFDFTDTYVRQVAVPRTDMVTVHADSTAREAMSVFLESGISRVPVVDDEADDVVGVLYLKDLVLVSFRDETGWGDAPVSRIARPPVFVPESMRAETLLQQMKRDAVHVCMVVDEYGAVSGLVTLEDLIEELVGEIADEYDPRAAEVVELEPGRYRVSSRLAVDDVGELFGLELDDEDVDSIGGLLGKALGRVPQPGATAVYDGLRLTGGASRGRGRGIATVFVERAAQEEAKDR